MKVLNKLCDRLTRGLLWLGSFFLVAMIVLTCANIFFRLVWIPVKGTFELMGFFGAIVTAFALSYTQMRRGHIAVDILINTFTKKTRKIVDIINHTLCCLFFCIAAWQIALKAATLLYTGEVTETLRIIYYPFTFGVAFGCVVLSLILFQDLVKTIIAKKEDGS
jgi:TRAP-type C4-dicarboxylate transport system permease small subunit